MSMETALKALEAAKAPVIPQGSQEVKETDSNPLQQSEKIEAIAPVSETKDAEPSTNKEVEAAPKEEAVKKEEEKKPEEPLSSKFAALAKKERLLVKQQNEIKAKEAGFVEKEASIAAREAKLKESESLWETNVFKALELKGYTYQKLTDMILEGKLVAEKAPEDPAILAQKTIDNFKKELEDKERAKDEAAKKAKEDADKKHQDDLSAAMDKFRKDIDAFVESNKEEYELIEMYGQQEQIFDVIDAYYNKHAKVLSIKESADIVEKYLLDEAQRAMKSKKLAPKSEGAKKEVAKKDEEPARIATKTLTNNLTPTAASVLPAANDMDRMKRAMAKLDGQR